jgi:hypothetical protein
MYHHHRRLSGSPQAPLSEFGTDDLPYPTRILSQKTLENIPAALGIDLPHTSTTTLAVPDEHQFEGISMIIPTHSPDCIYAASQSNHHNKTDSIKQTRKNTRKKTRSNTNNDLTSSISESSSAGTTEGIGINSSTISMTNGKPICTCQLLWQLERDTDSIDKFKLFFKRDHLNVDWDYVQGSSDV